MSKATDSKVLRIGIIQSGKIVEERLLRKRTKVTIGLAARNTFVLPLGTVKSHLLFDAGKEGYELCFTDGMDGRVAVRGNVLDFAGVRDQRVAKRRGNEWRLPLDEDARGKVMLGDVTVLFQFVAPPPVPATPKLPAVARGGWWKSLDWHYTSTVIGVAIVIVSLLVYMRSLEPPPKGPLRLEDLDSRFARLLAPELVKPPPEEKKPETQGPLTKVEAKKSEGDEAGKKAAKGPAKKPKPGGDDSVARAKSQGREVANDVRAKVGRTGLLAVIASEQGSGSAYNPVADVFSEGGIDKDLDSTFKKAEELGVAQQSLARSRAPKGGGDGVSGAESIGDEKIAGVGGGGSGKGRVRRVKVERTVERAVPKAALSLGKAEVEGGDVDADTVASVIKRRRSAILDCYERALKSDPSLKGKVIVRFTIGPTGAVISISATENSTGDSGVAQCIVSRVRGFRFPKPKPEGTNVTVEYPFILQAKT